MKKLTAILLSCTIALAATAIAKQDKNKSKGPQPQAPQNVKVNAGPKNKVKVHQNTPNPNPNSALVNPAKIQKKQLHEQQKDLRKTNVVSPNPNPNSALVNPAKIQKKQLHEQEKALRKTNVVTPKNVVTPNVIANDKLQKSVKAATLPKERIDQIRAQHLNFKAVPNTKIVSVRYNQNYQIAGAQNWTGPQYQAFVSYRPQWHDQTWWRSSRYSSNLLLIGGGWYFWDSGYWYPAWGYDQSASYYPYDGPIYVGDNPRPFDQVVADCQATLQEQGYYRGEVDGLMGPLTRQALADFQKDHGLISTAALDQPTLSSLGLG
jgi:hypothetical protein